MRRQAEQGGQTAGSGVGYRLDPFALPVRYTAALAGSARDDAASIVIDRDRVSIRRKVSSGVSTLTTLPVDAFKGVAVHMIPDGESGDILVTIELMHADPALSLPLAVADDPEEIAADWQSWAKVLGLPLYIVDLDGTARIAVEQIGPLQSFAPARRRKPSDLAKRRPRFLRRRKTGRTGALTVLSGREIIARN